eukprot:6935635-Prymnesium_polylepis.1
MSAASRGTSLSLANKLLTRVGTRFKTPDQLWRFVECLSLAREHQTLGFALTHELEILNAQSNRTLLRTRRNLLADGFASKCLHVCATWHQYQSASQLPLFYARSGSLTGSEFRILCASASRLHITLLQVCLCRTAHLDTSLLLTCRSLHTAIFEECKQLLGVDALAAGTTSLRVLTMTDCSHTGLSLIHISEPTRRS